MADAFEPRFVDLVRNFTTTIGEADFVLGAAVSGFTSFAGALAVGDRFYYCATSVDKPAEREIGRGTLLANGVIKREPVSGPLTKFSSGTKTVALVVAADWFGASQRQLEEVALVGGPDYVAGDGVNEDSIAIGEAFRSGRKVVFGTPPGGKYRLEYGDIVELTQPLEIDFGGHEIAFAGSVITFTSPKVASGRKLAVNTPRYSTAVTLNDVAGIAAGDLIVITTSVPGETGWNYTKKDVIKVRSVSGAKVELEEPTMFAYATTDAGLNVDAHRPQSVRLIRPFGTTAGPSLMFNFEYLENVEVISPKFVGSSNFDAAADSSRAGICFVGCWGATVRDAHFEYMSYPIMPSRGTRNILVDGLVATGCRHAIAPTDWVKRVLVRNLRASDCQGAIDSHPAFEVCYENAFVDRDRDLSNLRCVGGTLRNCRIHTLAGDNAAGPYYHSLSPSADVSSYLYADADFRIENVDIIAPNRTLPTIRVERGRNVYIDGLAAPAGAIAFSNASLNTVGQVLWGPNNQIGGRPSPSHSIATGVRCPIRILQPPLLNAYLDNGVYHIDPRLQMVDQSNNRLRCYGSVARLLSGASSFTLPIRIHTNPFGNIDSTSYVHGRLRLRSKTRHNSGGVFATVEKEFNFFHKAVQTSAVYFPLLPVFTSAASGQSNENNLALTIANPTQAGSSELGGVGDFYVGIDATIAMPVVVSPIFDLDYELELEAMQ